MRALAKHVCNQLEFFRMPIDFPVYIDPHLPLSRKRKVPAIE